MQGGVSLIAARIDSLHPIMGASGSIIGEADQRRSQTCPLARDKKPEDQNRQHGKRKHQQAKPLGLGSDRVVESVLLLDLVRFDQTLQHPLGVCFRQSKKD